MSIPKGIFEGIFRTNVFKLFVFGNFASWKEIVGHRENYFWKLYQNCLFFGGFTLV